MTVLTVLLAVLVFVGMLGASFMTCGPAREALETDEDSAVCPMRKYVALYLLAAFLLAVAVFVAARG